MLLTASRRLALLDELRVPYDAPHNGHAPGWHRLEAGHAARALHWYAAGEELPAQAFTAWGIPGWGRVAPAVQMEARARELPGQWQRAAPVHDASGDVCTWVLRSEQGGALLPFDPDEIVHNYRSEAYLRIGAPATAPVKSAARRVYYAVRPAVPRPLQLAARRTFSRVQGRGAFPRWPVEPALHDLTEIVLRQVAATAGEPVPFVRPWPRGRTWALVLTHDVETAVGRDAIGRVRAVEEPFGLKSSWNLVPERYAVSDSLVARLVEDGCEVGVHGLRHDGRDLESLRTLMRRLPEIRRWAAHWQAVGFRSPATHRVWDWMPRLGFDYDTSYPDTDPYEPMGGGCCTWLPFFNRGMVELPITLPQDHTLFEILRVGDQIWHEKADVLRRRGGMALLDTHPDYLLDDERLDAYAGLVSLLGRDPTVWKALPREVSQWWRRRAATSLELVGEDWRAVGPAAGDVSIAHLPQV
jgi:hypothetical protein